MSRNRCALLLSNFHFYDNGRPDNERPDDKRPMLYKSQVVVDVLNERFQNAYEPQGQNCIGDASISFRRRLKMWQCIPNKPV